MQSTKHDKKLGKEKLERIIEMCIAIENHTVDPFTLNVDEIIKIVREYFPNWENPEELKLDAEALHHLAISYQDAERMGKTALKLTLH